MDPVRRAVVWSQLLAGVVALALLVPAGPARASSADEADVNFSLATQAYQAGRYEDALLHFLQSNRLAPNSRVMFNIARTFEALGRYPEAHRWYLNARDATTEAAALAAVNDSLNRIAPQVAVLRVVTNPPGATVYVERKELGSVSTTPAEIAYRPGKHKVLLELEGYEGVATEAIDLRIGNTTDLTYDLVRIVGQVRVDGVDGATVHLASEDTPALCTAPCVVDLPPGQQLLYFVRPGFRSLPRIVEVLQGQEIAVRPEMVPITGTVIVRGQERGALIEIDGKAKGFTPAVLTDVPVGPAVVRVTLPGFDPFEQQVEVSEEEPVDLSRISLVPSSIVSAASRVAEDISDAPASITVISGAELRAFAYPTIYDALRGVRGTASSFDSTYSSVAVRGLGQSNDYSRRILLLNDGYVLNDAVLFQAYLGYDSRTDLGDVERIEVVRGPGSVLYGTGAVSGVVNLVTRDHARPTGGGVAVSAYDTALRARGEAQVNLGDGGVWVSLAGARSPGRTEQIDSGRGPAAVPVDVEQFDAFEAYTLAGNAWVKDLTAQWFFNSRAQTIPTGAYGMLLNDTRANWQDTRGFLELRYQPVLVTDKLQLFTRAYGDYSDFDATYVFPGEPYYDDALLTDEKYVGWIGGAEARTIATFGGLRWTAGVDVRNAFALTMDGVLTYPDGTEEVFLEEDQPYSIVAGYTVFDWQIVKGVKVSAGGRLDSWSTFGLTFNPRLAAILRPTDDDTIKLMGGSAFRAPSPWEIGYNDGGFAQLKPEDVGIVLEPERLQSVELEYSHDFPNRFTGLVSAHATRVESIIDSVLGSELENVPTGSEGAIVYQNSDQLFLSRGADLEIRRDYSGGWMLSAYYGFLFADEVDPDDDLVTAFFEPDELTRIPNAPYHFAAARVIAPISEPFARLALRTTLEAPRRISAVRAAETETSLIVDLVLSGDAPGSGVRYAIGAYNIADDDFQAPVGDQFQSATMPQAGRTFFANVSFEL